MPIADDINHHPEPGGPGGHPLGAGHQCRSGSGSSRKNVEPAKEFIQFLFRKENFDAWIVASNAFNQPPLRNLADHPIWAKNPKFAMLPKEAEYAHARGWPSQAERCRAPDREQLRAARHGVQDDQRHAHKRAMEWAQEQVMQGVRGQLKAGG